MDQTNKREIELTVIECGGNLRKEKFKVLEIKNLTLNCCGETLVLAHGGWYPVKESIHEIEKSCQEIWDEAFLVNPDPDHVQNWEAMAHLAAMRKVYCPNCGQEVMPYKHCTLCGESLEDPDAEKC